MKTVSSLRPPDRRRTSTGRWPRVLRIRGEPCGRRLLSDLSAGLPVGEAIAAALGRRGAPAEDALTRWFGEWAADGLFTRIEHPGE